MIREAYTVLILSLNNTDWLLVVLRYQQSCGALFVVFMLLLRCSSRLQHVRNFVVNLGCIETYINDHVYSCVL